jgi:outer membrane lipoprotein-sorting protein
MKPQCFILFFFLAYFCWGAGSPSDQAEEIVQRSVANTKADWDAAPQYNFTERDVITRHGRRTDKTFRVMMIEGSPYNKLIAIDGEPLSAEQAAIADRKFQQAIDRRRNESTAERQKRVAEYERERRQNHALMAEMTNGFDFKLQGEETVNGRPCFVLVATPKPGYRPPSRDTQVLKGMRGKMWVDEQQYQWVKVHAEVFRSVSFGLFFASVKPGTEFTLEEEPVQGDLWLPSHFRMEVNARVLFSSRHSIDDETYSNYQPST